MGTFDEHDIEPRQLPPQLAVFQRVAQLYTGWDQAIKKALEDLNAKREDPQLFDGTVYLKEVVHPIDWAAKEVDGIQFSSIAPQLATPDGQTQASVGEANFFSCDVSFMEDGSPRVLDEDIDLGLTIYTLNLSLETPPYVQNYGDGDGDTIVGAQTERHVLTSDECEALLQVVPNLAIDQETTMAESLYTPDQYPKPE